MVRAADSNGAFDFTIARVRPGTEPPPHIHSGEDEFFHVSSGEMRVYVGAEAYTVTAGECFFLPRQIPHAWLITSDEANLICVITPAGFADALEKMSFPAERMEIPTDPDILTYATADLTETIEVLKQYGVRLLTPDEIRVEMPEFPLPPGDAR